MKNRLSGFLAQILDACGGPKQDRLIALHEELTAEMEKSNGLVRGHYEHLLLALKRVIESYGPSDSYRQWISSTSAN